MVLYGPVAAPGAAMGRNGGGAQGGLVGQPVAAAAELSVTVIPISGPLGLADVKLEDAAGRGGGGLERATVLLQMRGGGGVPERPLMVPMVRDAAGLWTARVMALPWPNPYEASRAESEVVFSIEVHEKGQGGTRRIGPFRRSAAPEAAKAIPEWALGAVWYQIFPERFGNGEPLNDPRPPLVPDVVPKAWLGDWESVPADELELNRALGAGTFPARALPPNRRGGGGGQLYNVVLNRRYGGDLQGVVQRLDHLAELGVTAIYFNPVFHAHSLHKYDATDFRHIDPTLGWPDVPDMSVPVAGETADPATWTWTPADRYFIGVVLPECHRRGIHVVLDGVWNHVGTRFWAFQDVMERGEGSPYAAWFQPRFAPSDPVELGAIHDNWPGLAIGAGSVIGWSSWNGRNGSLPIFARAAGRAGEPQGGLRLHPEVEAHVFAVTRRWMDPNGDGDPSDGIDGWRLDVAPDVPIEFWRAWRAHARAINPDAVLIGEVWPDAAAWFDGVAFDSQTNYPFTMPVVRWLERGSEMTPKQLAASLQRAFSHAPHTDLAQMNLLGSHDTERIVSMLANPGRPFDQAGSPSSNPRYDAGRPDAETYRRMLLGVVIQATHPGAPMVYYGDEWGMHGADDPSCRKPLPWPDLGTPENPDDAPDAAILEEYRRWLRLRQDPVIGPVLRFGSVEHVESGHPDVLAFRRRLNNHEVLVVVNRGTLTFDALPLQRPGNPEPSHARDVGPLSAKVMHDAQTH
ncbi:MAG: glycoside hydrolase family 13 protein [Phycisphaerales bacterium]|nr:glycoside hydrolase family 13 protein [Phycisphaerales bacterium]